MHTVISGVRVQAGSIASEKFRGFTGILSTGSGFYRTVPSSTDRHRILPTVTEFYRRHRFILTKSVWFLLTLYYVPTSEPLCFVQVHPLTFPRPPPLIPSPHPPIQPPHPARPALAPSSAASLRWPPARNDRISLTGTVFYLTTERPNCKKSGSMSHREIAWPSASATPTILHLLRPHRCCRPCWFLSSHLHIEHPWLHSILIHTMCRIQILSLAINHIDRNRRSCSERSVRFRSGEPTISPYCSANRSLIHTIIQSKR